MRYEYKVETFKCAFKTAKNFNQTLQDLINKYANEGWRLHTTQLAADGCVCVCVFEREI